MSYFSGAPAALVHALSFEISIFNAVAIFVWKFRFLSLFPIKCKSFAISDKVLTVLAL